MHRVSKTFTRLACYDFDTRRPILIFLGRHVTERVTVTESSGIDRVQALGDISRSALCYHSNEIRAPISQIRPMVQKYKAPPTIPPTYIRVCAVVLECGEGQTYRDRQTHRHTDGRHQYTFRLSYALREM